jgi:hypothetical protein
MSPVGTDTKGEPSNRSFAVMPPINKANGSRNEQVDLASTLVRSFLYASMAGTLAIVMPLHS